MIKVLLQFFKAITLQFVKVVALQFTETTLKDLVPKKPQQQKSHGNG
jgi:hypothetical protein